MNSGWIKIHRKMLDWEWYDDIPTKILLLHLLLTANYENKKWHGHPVLKGERITSLQHLADETQLTVQQVRTALIKLEKTGEVTRKATNKYTHIVLTKWDKYQETKQPSTSKATNEQQTDNKRTTTTKEGKKARRKEKDIAPLSADAGKVNLVLEKFQMTVNPGINYGNKTNRKAAQWLIDKCGMEKTLRTIEYLEQIRSEPYAPIITTPYQLKEKFGQLIAYHEKNEAQSNKNEIAII